MRRICLHELDYGYTLLHASTFSYMEFCKIQMIISTRKTKILSKYRVLWNFIKFGYLTIPSFINIYNSFVFNGLAARIRNFTHFYTHYMTRTL